MVPEEVGRCLGAETQERELVCRSAVLVMVVVLVVVVVVELVYR